MTPTDKARDSVSPARSNNTAKDAANDTAIDTASNTASQTDSSSSANGEGGDTRMQSKDKPEHVAQNAVAPETDLPEELPPEHGGQAGLDPTRYGDWEKKGRCTDF